MITTFEGFGLLPQLEENLKNLNYSTPTPIQSQAIPPLLEGRDLLGIAQTGTGKTAAFSLPLIQKLSQEALKMRPGKCRTLILAPTRELASQIQKDIKCYSEGLRLKSAVIFGGVKQHNQVRALKGGLDLLVATPGRLEDLISQGHAKLDQVDYLVLDEADRMLDMGFLPAIKRILAQLPEKRQTLLFSATMPTGIAQLTKGFQEDPVRVEIDPESSTVDRITQEVVHVPQTEKLGLLQTILKLDEVEQVMVFSRTKHGAERLSKGVRAMKLDCEAIHGNKSQNQRQKALDDFKAGTLKVLVATDIAARGIDVAGVSHVINYDLPEEPESYVHRIGRTGRAGREGVAISFCSGPEVKKLKAIEKAIGVKIPQGDFARAEWSQMTAREEAPAKRNQARPSKRTQAGGFKSRSTGTAAPKRSPRRGSSEFGSNRNF
ncbi:MAG: DEAD/DEAH box helicase [SAR324 cluster bacterium]|nr:DEAD/DEAH box helicase [SAR324 cluster bacterium]